VLAQERAVMFWMFLLQTDTGKMVWQKSGRDRAVFSGTLATISVVGGYVGYLLFYWIFPQQ